MCGFGGRVPRRHTRLAGGEASAQRLERQVPLSPAASASSACRIGMPRRHATSACHVTTPHLPHHLTDLGGGHKVASSPKHVPLHVRGPCGGPGRHWEAASPTGGLCFKA